MVNEKVFDIELWHYCMSTSSSGKTTSMCFEPSNVPLKFDKKILKKIKKYNFKKNILELYVIYLIDTVGEFISKDGYGVALKSKIEDVTNNINNNSCLGCFIDEETLASFVTIEDIIYSLEKNKTENIFLVLFNHLTEMTSYLKYSKNGTNTV